MSNVYFISDLHIGHKNILNFSHQYRDGDTVDEHDHILIDRIAGVASSKRDILYILGDVCMEVEKMELLTRIPARKILVRGNHDTFQDGVYRKYFEKILGLAVYKRHWLSHAPVHPHELRKRKNIHGHVHNNSVMKSRYTQEFDTDYINVCVENNRGYPVNFKDIEAGDYKGVIS